MSEMISIGNIDDDPENWNWLRDANAAAADDLDTDYDVAGGQE